MSIAKNLHWLVYLLFFCCAKQSSPTGGPKDTIPPRLVKAIPINEAINFQGKSLEMTFSEMITLNNPKEQLIITPTIGKDFEVKARKNKVTLEFKNALEDNTTYTFNFRESVQDITEKNPTKNFQLAISTGPYVDSLSIEGTVYDIIEGTEKQNITVAIHYKNDTFNIFKHPATYFTKTDKSGKFKIDHLKPGQYYIYALDDKNKNLFADTKTESYGFLRNPINLKNDTANISIGILHLDARPLRLASARPYNTYFNIRTTKNIKDFKLAAKDSSELYYSFAEDQSNIKLYKTISPKDSIGVQLTAFDSIGNWLDTTFYAKFPERESTPEKFDFKISSAAIIADKGLFNATIAFNKPLKEVNFDSLYFEIDSLRRINFSNEDFSWDQLYNVLTVRKTIDKNLLDESKPNEEQDPNAEPSKRSSKRTAGKRTKSKNQLFIGKGTFISVEQDSSKKTSQAINPLKREDLSEIIFDIKSNDKNIIVQLLDNNFNILDENTNQLKGSFKDLIAGEYMMRVIIDSNKNLMWDAGNYFKKEEPERIIYYHDPDKKSPKIKLNSNWEFELAPLLITN